MARILVTDDSMLQRMNLNRLFKGLGHEVVEAEDGEQCLEMLKTESFDLMTLDLLMPGKTGIDVLMETQDQDNLPPVIVVTADTQVTVVNQCKELGCKYFLNKPIDGEDLIALVDEILGS